MEGRPGRRRRRRVKAPARAAIMDWISGLPDEILHHIMSFLNARQAVQTCVLSRRWSDLWRTVPCINADFNVFDFIDYQGDDEDYNDEVAFKRFVNRMLELRDPATMIDTFWLRYKIWDGYNEYKDSNVDANRWISHALQKQAMVMEVVVFSFPLELDHSVFHFMLPEKNWSLKVLTIDDTEFSKANKASISIPSVTSLTLSSPENSTPVLKDMALLTTASVSVKFYTFSYGFDANDLRQCLWSLSGVTDLEFNYEGTELTFENNLQWCPEFINVVNLTLGQWCLDANFYALIVFLQNSPRLEKLTLNLAKCIWKKSPRTVSELMERSFTCEHLKIVEVKCLKDDPQVISVQDFFASNGMASVQFHIKHWGQYEEEDELPAFIRYEER
uniref:F-box domain-containing protein n=1 Tax=Oryza glumipatula TaxID=40148 RepID=A0A0E0B7G4_9ORYZ